MLELMKNVLSKVKKVASFVSITGKRNIEVNRDKEYAKFTLILIRSSLVSTIRARVASMYHSFSKCGYSTLYVVYVSPMPPCEKLIWSIVSLSCPSFKLQKLDAPPLNPPHARLSVSQTTESTAMLCMRSQSTQAKYRSAFQLEKQFCQLRKIKTTTGMTNLRF